LRSFVVKADHVPGDADVFAMQAEIMPIFEAIIQLPISSVPTRYQPIKHTFVGVDYLQDQHTKHHPAKSRTIIFDNNCQQPRDLVF
jgi:hypothetical protein